MPISEVEREHIIEVERLRDEIHRSLQEAHPSGQFWQHPAILLILGFIFTTIVGSWLTYFWKNRDWKNQQTYLVQRRSLDRKIILIESIFQEVATTTAAADDVLSTYYGEYWTDKDVEERWENLKKTSLAWRTQSKVLSARLAANFSNPEIQGKFQEMVNKRRQLGNIFLNIPRRKKNEAIEDTTLKEVQRGNDLMNQIMDLVHKCGSLMATEVKDADTS